MRKLATSKTPNLPALNYPAPVTPSHTINLLPTQQMTLPVQTPYQLAYAKAQAKLNGVYVIGSNTCPNCGDFRHLRDVSGMWVWSCCYSPCNECDEPHAYPDSDVCGNCDSHTGCDCVQCNQCGDQAKCQDCGNCEHHCRCNECPSYGCHNKLAKVGGCDNCENCSECCDCFHRDSCGDVGGDYCGECGHCTDCCSCKKGQGNAEQPGWAVRGQSVAVRFKGIDYGPWNAVDPVRAMADFYVLSYMVEGSDPGQMAVAAVAAQARKDLVDVLDPVFQAYLDVAIGGELRHHRAIDMMSKDRAEAWGQWASIRNQVGPAALLDAAELFLEMDSNYGGQPWAMAARILHSRVIGKIPAWVFVDRVFTLQHNNGSMLNKPFSNGGWATHHNLYGGPELCLYVGEAHSATITNLEFLLFVASPATNTLFNQWWTARNRGLMALGGRPELRPSFAGCIQKDGDYGFVFATTLSGRYRQLMLNPEYLDRLRREARKLVLAKETKALAEAKAATVAMIQAKKAALALAKADLLIDPPAAEEAVAAAVAVAKPENWEPTCTCEICMPYNIHLDQVMKETA